MAKKNTQCVLNLVYLNNICTKFDIAKESPHRINFSILRKFGVDCI